MLPPAGRRDTWGARGRGLAAALGATLSLRRLEECWEMADSERHMSEEENSRRLAQGRWKKIFLKKAGKIFALKVSTKPL